MWKKEKLCGDGRPLHHEPVHGGDLRPGPEGAATAFACRSTWSRAKCIERRWNKWREHDPINLVAKYRDNLKSLRGIYIDCGWRDQYHIHYGSRILSKRLAAAGIRHTYEEFDDDHSDIDYRMDVSLPFLYRALKP